MKTCFFNLVVPIWINPPLNITEGNFPYHNAKTITKEQFFASFKENP